MQNNVNAENVLNELVHTFGDIAVSTCDAGVIKLQVRELRNGDLLAISNLLLKSDIQVKRSGPGLLILFIPKIDSDPYPKEVSDALDSIVGSDIIPGESPKVISKREQFVEVATPVIDFINSNYHPHTTVLIDCNHAELLEGEIAFEKSERKEP